MRTDYTEDFNNYLAARMPVPGINYERLHSLVVEKNITLTLDCDADATEWLIALAKWIEEKQFKADTAFQFFNIAINFV